MKTLAVIPARLGATRLTRKPLRLLAGAPLVVRVWERVMALRIADHCIVATDSAEVAAAAREGGALCVLTSPEHPSGTDRVAEAVRRPEFAAYDAVLNVQGDEPFVDADALQGAVTLVTSGRFPLGTAAAAAPPAVLDQPHVVKVVTADDDRAMYFSRASIPYLREPSERALRDARILQHVGVYAYTREALATWVALPPHPLEQIERLEQLRPLAAGLAMGVARLARAPLGGIDTEADLAHANAHWNDFTAGRT